MGGDEIYGLAKALWPLNRSLTGEGVRKTLKEIKNVIPDLRVYDVPSGTEVFDWIIPKEWHVNEAWIKTPSGKKICNFNENNLHLVGYSIPFKGKLSLDELQNHLYSLENQKDAIPYITSYYKERWGFCLSQDNRDKLEEGEYEVFIDSKLFDGFLTYGELIIKGETESEIFLSTYICHPSMANNELSGPCVTSYLAKWITSLEKRKFSYRIIFIPETIGSITYLSKNIETMKKNIIAGYNISCIGDNRAYSYLPSRNGKTISDKIAKHVLSHIDNNFIEYKWSDRGSDERQYCSPNVDLPIASIMRTKFGEYPEYHTSLDNLDNVVTPDGLMGGFLALKKAITAIEKNSFPMIKVLGEPQLGKHGLYPSIGGPKASEELRVMMNLITHADGKKDLIDIAEICKIPVWDLYPVVKILVDKDLLSI
tara:strand:- start:2924 stop:4198 length:1275 start_codon:yes stop_codon:yes gene_type:complete